MRQNSVRGLRTFCVAARCLSFKAAAEELCVTPSAVSHQIKGLEQQLQARLFERRTREIALTELGSTLFAQVAPLLIGARQRDGAVPAAQRTAPRAAYHAAAVLRERDVHSASERFADQNRAIDIRVETTEAGCPASVGERRVDTAVVVVVRRNWYVAHPLFPLRLAPACSPQLARELKLSDPRALLGATLIVHKARPHAWQDWFASMSIGLDRAPKVIHLDSMFAVARAAERGLGVALVPIPLAGTWFNSGALVRPCIGELETTDRYYFVYRAEAAKNPDVCALRDWVIATFAQDQDERMSAVA